MTVEELIKILRGLPRNMDVIISVDSEGNEYNYCDGFSIGKFDGEEYTDDACRNYDNCSDEKVICLWP